MRAILLSFLVVLPAFASLEPVPCALEKPMALKGKYPLRDRIRIADARFDDVPRFATPGAYRPASDKLEVDLFDIRLEGRPQRRLGAAVTVVGQPHTLGFTHNYLGDDVEFIGGCGVENGNVVYLNRKEDKYVAGPHAVGTAVTEVASSVDEDGRLALLRLTYPVFRPVSADAPQVVYWTGEQHTLCLKAGVAAKPAAPDDDGLL